jgi:NAD+ kinase
MGFAIVANPYSRRCIEKAKEIYDFLTEKGQNVILEEKLSHKLGLGDGVPLDAINIETIITVGGDGTVLITLQRAHGKILSIDMGALGFLTEVPPDRAFEYLEKYLQGEYYLEVRRKLRVDLNDERLPDCANEAVIHTSEIANIRSFRVYVDDELLGDIRADGMIVATSTGSTSYALSTGGPILHPRISGFVITYIAPFRRSVAPHVVPSRSIIKVELTQKYKEYIVVLDGQEQRFASYGDVLTFRESENVALFVRFSKSFYTRLREKMGL